MFYVIDHTDIDKLKLVLGADRMFDLPESLGVLLSSNEQRAAQAYLDAGGTLGFIVETPERKSELTKYHV